ncbi:hypothetical protein COO59_10260 [Mixta theicola]|uniref:Uncharacterized protein n=1 Tax=Mixta theicola TaxID=1458355 RepID=A0A2K1QA04_9GAMM|nr:hypothetical protein COO59_10260 [Mixta theicola]
MRAGNIKAIKNLLNKTEINSVAGTQSKPDVRLAFCYYMLYAIIFMCQMKGDLGVAFYFFAHLWLTRNMLVYRRRCRRAYA